MFNRRVYRRRFVRRGGLRFPGRVKQVVKKMHGLNTYHSVIYLQPTSWNYETGTPYHAVSYIFNISSPADLLSNIPAMVDTDDLQFYIKRLYSKSTFTNVSLHGVMMEVTTLVARNDIRVGQTINSIASTDVTGYTNGLGALQVPYASWALSDSFKKNFKILASKKRILKPGQLKTVTCKVQKSYLRKPVSANVEGDSIGYNYREGNIIKVVRFYGLPTNWLSSGIDNGVGLTPVVVRAIQTRYASYYRMDDAKPDAQIAYPNQFTTSSASNNATWNPTYATIAYNGTTIDPVQPAIVENIPREP